MERIILRIMLLILSSVIAIITFIVSRNVQSTWIKKSFNVYGTMFAITTVFIGMTIMHENKSEIKIAINDFIDSDVAEATEEIAAPAKATEGLNSPLQYDTDTTANKQAEHLESIQLEAPLIGQLPELPRGCEVTTLSMLLGYHGIDIDKMDLAESVVKDPSTYEVIDDDIHFGNPYNGFVGDMYSFDTPGLGVYHGPIAALAEEYAGERVRDFSGEDFSTIIDELNKGHPVWVIINATYEELPEDAFTTWHTEDGPLDITMHEHSVLITGYDAEYIYFNDPLQKEEKALLEDFKAAWIQMGKQAITIYKK